MTDYLQSAFSLADDLRSRAAFTKAGDTSSAMLTGNTFGYDNGYSKLTKHREQYSHFSGWPYVAIRAIAQRVAGQPLYVGRVGRPTRRKLSLPGCLKFLGDKVEPLESHALLTALNDPNPVMVRWSLMYSTAASLCLTGRSHWWLTSDDQGSLQVWPVPAHWLRPSDPMRGSWYLRPDNSADEFEIANDDVASFMLPDPSSPFGCVSPLQSQAAAVSIDENIQRTQFDLFKSGVHPQLAIRIGKQSAGPDDYRAGLAAERPVLTAEQRTEVVESILKLYGGTARRNNPLILDGLIEGVDRLNATPQEMDFLNSGQQTKARILQAFGVNPIIAGEIENANRASAAVAADLFAEHTVNPLLALMSEVLTEWVAKRFESGLVAWIEPARANDPELKLSEWKAGASLGYVTQNEFRRNVLNLPDVPGGDTFRDALGNPIGERSTLPEFSRNGHSRIS